MSAAELWNLVSIRLKNNKGRILVIGLLFIPLLVIFQNFSPVPAFNADCQVYGPPYAYSNQTFDLWLSCQNTGTETWNGLSAADTCALGFCIGVTYNDGFISVGGDFNGPPPANNKVMPGQLLYVLKHMKAPSHHSSGPLKIQYRMYGQGLGPFGNTAPPPPAPYLQISFRDIGQVQTWQTPQSCKSLYFPNGVGCLCSVQNCNNGTCSCDMGSCQGGVCKALCQADGNCPAGGGTCDPMVLESCDNTNIYSMQESDWDSHFSGYINQKNEICDGLGTLGLQNYFIIQAEFNYTRRLASKFVKCDCLATGRPCQ